MVSLMSSPASFQDYLDSLGLLDRFYDFMAKNDVANMVMEAMSILKKINLMPHLVKHTKYSIKSAELRTCGNTAFKGNDDQIALQYYNNALMVAPKDSQELILAYSNRSALFWRSKKFEACLSDIDTCLKLNCPESLKAKLVQRKNDAVKHVWNEKMIENRRYSSFSVEYLKFNERRNPQIPCASLDVGVKVDLGVPTVVAVKEVKVGKILAVEEAFVSTLDKSLNFNACHHCHKMALNLFPCEGCCHALFCSEECQRACLEEYHRMECQITEIFLNSSSMPMSRIALQAAIKLRNKFNSWEEFIQATSKLGRERIKISSVKEMFDGNSNYSMLNFNDDTIPVYGNMYNSSWGCATLLHYLSSLSFFPSREEERTAAMGAFARLMMYYTLHGVKIPIVSVVSIIKESITGLCKASNMGIFPFVGKLKHACMPNVMALGLNNKIALIALQPLKPGMELTIAPTGHWLDVEVGRDKRWLNIYQLYRTACDCAICNGSFKNILSAIPNETQMRHLEKLNLEQTMTTFTGRMVPDLFPKVCKVMALFNEMTFSVEYKMLFILFRKCLLELQDCHSMNIMVSDVKYTIINRDENTIS